MVPTGFGKPEKLEDKTAGNSYFSRKASVFPAKYNGDAFKRRMNSHFLGKLSIHDCLQRKPIFIKKNKRCLVFFMVIRN